MTPENNRNINSDLSPFLQHTWQESEGEGRGNQSPILGERANAILLAQKKIWLDPLSSGMEKDAETRLAEVIWEKIRTGLESSEFQATSLHAGSVTALQPAAFTQLAAKPERWVRTDFYW